MMPDMLFFLNKNVYFLHILQECKKILKTMPAYKWIFNSYLIDYGPLHPHFWRQPFLWTLPKGLLKSGCLQKIYWPGKMMRALFFQDGCQTPLIAQFLVGLSYLKQMCLIFHHLFHQNNQRSVWYRIICDNLPLEGVFVSKTPPK